MLTPLAKPLDHSCFVVRLLTCALVGLLLNGAQAHAQSGIPGFPERIYAYDPREVAMLPVYCKHTNLFRQKIPGANDPEKVQYWRSVMGPTRTGSPEFMFETMHHYCWALMHTNRASIARSQEFRERYLKASLSDFDYIIRNAARNFVLLPEVFTRKGENLLRLGKTRDGMQELERAIQLKPDYWPPYAAIADHYAESGEFAEARRTLEKGLAADPDSKALQLKLSELKSEARKQ